MSGLVILASMSCGVSFPGVWAAPGDLLLINHRSDGMCPKLGYTDSVLVLSGEAALEEDPCLGKKRKRKRI